ncbi:MULTISPECIES: zinc ribbon domain-containing protein [unclassified Vibrio]|uniref:zinc ribbon domain-containing protein n=1 Tax=unclassified Vibrio TaxID=2614977 RepID=UPI001361AF1D|nr:MULTISPECIES: zinc ribbon domain-containing protein [unclassified Vibrio]NAW55988.1 DNA ligase [Vibrio sp. V36_P2S2PM302]NAX24298.1 DNA ligase [Vibrio sp. V38_P2S17PM301]NAX29488.1 DNA ligase [Vibrio sp. V37_P2S8PM304]
MSHNLCPTCQDELEWDGRYVCGHCQTHFQKAVYCPECGASLEKLQACGVTSYFCNQCNELKSKSKVQIEFIPCD